MEKNIDVSAKIKRIGELSGIKKAITENKNENNTSTLISTYNDNDGNVYGIVRENHDFYIKKSLKKEDPSINDFIYITGLKNKSDYRYSNNAIAEKSMNAMLITLNESYKYKINKNSTKLVINENAEFDEKISSSKEKIDNLDSEIENKSKTNNTEIDTNSEIDTNINPDENNDTVEIENGDDDLNLGNENGDDENIDTDINDIENDEIASKLGKLVNIIRDKELTPVQTKSYINTYLSAFTDSLPNVEIEDRQKMAKKILKVVDDKEIENLGDNVEDENIEEGNDNQFADYIQSMGYTRENITGNECSIEEIANLISGYANAYNEEKNDGDFENVALFTDDKINEKLCKEYGHDEYVNKLSESYSKISKLTDAQKKEKINEISWGGLKNVGKHMGNQISNAVGNKVTQASNAIKSGVSGAINKLNNTYGNVVNNFKELGNDYMSIYRKEEFNDQLRKLEKIASELGSAANKLNAASIKAGLGEINLNGLLTTISNQLRGGKGASLNKYKVNEEIDDTIETDDIKQDDELEINDNDLENVGNNELSNINQMNNINTGLDMDDDNTIDVVVDGQQKKIEITLNESIVSKIVKNRLKEKISNKKSSINESVRKSKQVMAIEQYVDGVYDEYILENKIRKYVKNRLMENLGVIKKPINESKKNEKLKKLDSLIDKTYTLYEEKLRKSMEKINEDHLSSTKDRKQFIKSNIAKLNDKGIEKIYLQIEKMLGVTKEKQDTK